MLRMYDTLENKLNRFHKAFGHPIRKEFSVEDSQLSLALIQEEFKELIEAVEKGEIPEIKKRVS